MNVTLPMRLQSLANLREPWQARSRRAKSQRAAALAVPVWRIKLPCSITITRIAPRPLDSDNLAISAKHLRDGIADRLGIKDNDPRVEWRYAQERGKPKEYAVRVEAVASKSINA